MRERYPKVGQKGVVNRAIPGINPAKDRIFADDPNKLLIKSTMTQIFDGSKLKMFRQYKDAADRSSMDRNQASSACSGGNAYLLADSIHLPAYASPKPNESSIQSNKPLKGNVERDRRLAKT